VKALKFLLLAVLGCVVLGALLVAVALVPAVQKRVFLSFANEEGQAVEVGRIAAGFGGVEIANLGFRRADADISVERVSVKLPVLRLMLDRRRIHVEEIVIEGVKADVRSTGAQTTPSEGQGAKRETEGPVDFESLKLPLALTIERIAISGEATLPDSGKGRPRGTFSLKGGDFGPGNSSRLALTGTWMDPSQAGVREGVAIDGEITLHQTEALEIDSVAIRLNTPLASGDARFSAPGGKIADAVASGSFTADLDKLVALVPVEVRPPLTKGSLSLRFEARRDSSKTMQVAGSTTVEKLAGATDEATFEAIAVEWSASIPENAAASISAKLLATPGGASPSSDFSLSGTALSSKDGVALDLELASTRVAVEGLTRLADLAVPATPAGPEAPGPEPPDEVPAWDGVSGIVRFAFAEVLLPEGATVRDTKGTIKIDGPTVTIAGLEGVALESPFRSDLTIAFDRDKGGYVMNGGIVLDRFDAGKALQALQSGVAPQLEGIFSTNAKVKASGGTLAALAEKPAANISIHGSEGVFRRLKRAASSTSSIIGLIGSIARSDELAGVSQLASALATIPYEEVAIEASLAGDRSLEVRTFRLRGTNILLEGSGNLKPLEKESFLRWPIGLQLNLAGKCRVAQLLETLYVAAPKPNAQGFTELRFPFKLGGSLLSPDANDLWRNLAREAGAALLERRRSESESTPVRTTDAAPAEQPVPPKEPVKPTPAPGP